MNDIPSLRRWWLALVIGVSAATGATPTSIGGLIYHEIEGFPGVTWQMTIAFRADGTFSYVKNTSTQSGLTSFSPLPSDGTYTYTRITEKRAVITLQDPTASLFYRHYSPNFMREIALYLNFTDDVSGTGHNPGVRFHFTKPGENRAPVVNVSLRGSVGPGRPLIAGFVVPGGATGDRNATDLLIRVVGPSLILFGVPNVWSDPNFVVHGRDPLASTIVQFGDWSSTRDARMGFQRAANAVGAFPLTVDSKDATALVRLPPGAYTVVCEVNGADTGGDALIEVYSLP